MLADGQCGPRPLWLLEIPRDLGCGALPALTGPLRLLSGAERIESGWWDGADVARDYFVAAAEDGPHYWVYRDCSRESRWFLQGVFA
jgi:protein ImuB